MFGDCLFPSQFRPEIIHRNEKDIWPGIFTCLPVAGHKEAHLEEKSHATF